MRSSFDLEAELSPVGSSLRLRSAIDLWQIAAKSRKITATRAASKQAENRHTATDDALDCVDLHGGIGDCQLREPHTCLRIILVGQWPHQGTVFSLR